MAYLQCGMKMYVCSGHKEQTLYETARTIEKVLWRGGRGFVKEMYERERGGGERDHQRTFVLFLDLIYF